ncbi:MAG: hypothetical protein EXS14_00080 [Planctomycetes bacterium]|nr:hypothetical protein [Planctomycetota bacterium]
MRKIHIAAGFVCVAFLVAAVSPQDQDLQARVAKLEQQVQKSERQREALEKRAEQLEKWRKSVLQGASALDESLSRVETAGFTKAACSAESRERLLGALKELSSSIAER